MDAIETCYMSATKSILPLGRFAFLPYSYVQTTLQTLRYFIMNILSYMRLVFVYHNNLLHVGRETELERETFKITYNQRKFKNKHRVRNSSLPVASDIRELFDPPTKLSEYIIRIWFRTGYYYDKYIIHYPMAILNGSVHSYIYDPSNSTKFVASKKLSSSNRQENKIKNVEKIDFIPKPYVITETVKKKSSPKLLSSDISGCPVLSGVLFEPPLLTNKNDVSDTTEFKDQKTELDNGNETENKPTIQVKSPGKSFYKIKIRRKQHLKSDDDKNHPTYGRYDLLAQAIKNIIPQPNYLPDGTIGPNMIRFSWHCCAHYDQATGTGGSSGGTMRFAQEFNDLGNTGLTTTKSYLDQIHQQFPWISCADLYTFAGCVAIEFIGGPKIEWKAGRSDCPDASKVPPMGRLPIATKDYNHIQVVFYNRLGFTAQETVALIGGGHGIGSCHARYSGFNGIWTRSPFKWDNSFFKVLLEEDWSLGIVPETGIQQYYNNDKSLMMLNTDIELLRFPEFRRWVEIFANDQDFFNQQFAIAFAKLLELGVIRDSDGIQRVKI
jgi:hypothetical protein